ncbi:MAG: TerB family tellurite resistance protein [Pseudomonadota bacterium]
MLEKIISALKVKTSGANAASIPQNVKQLAAAALMVEAARRDSNFDDKEHKAISRIVAEEFDLSDEDAKSLVDVAEQRQRLPYGESIFTRTIAEHFSDKERQDVVTMLWKVALADGDLARVEVAMIERLAKEIGLDATATAAARAAAH